MISLWLAGLIAVVTASRWIRSSTKASGASPPQGIPILAGTKDTDYKTLVEEQYLKMQTCVEIPGASFKAALALAQYHRLVRPVAALFIPEMKRLCQLLRVIHGLLRPLHQGPKQRQQALRQAEFKRPVDVIQSFVDDAGKEARNTDRLVEAMVMINIAGVQSTSRVGGEDQLLATGLAKLHRMDSVLKESQRLRHANLRALHPLSTITDFPLLTRRSVSAYRKLIQPLTLSNGIVLPAESYVAVPGSVYARLAEDGRDRSFDGFQWADKKGKTGTDSKFNYAFSGPDSLEFGAGSHACPGRHFAVNVLKATLSRILLRYDLCLPPGTERPRDQFNHLFDIVPNAGAELVFVERA
ncbi:cytochrome P450 [Aspergillus affinis]|uniref:cytochrome P450 n=1 Tax=Aspergillus affinis TaxID=1070780 RepID=UPI0022FF19E1|nr:putative cytochrome P450 oxidoreductase [Aspergillus affinis]KAI9044181.1 putative cytochrome P450 oxidoreductase [Aspergillus affinis]